MASNASFESANCKWWAPKPWVAKGSLTLGGLVSGPSHRHKLRNLQEYEILECPYLTPLAGVLGPTQIHHEDCSETLGTSATNL